MTGKRDKFNKGLKDKEGNAQKRVRKYKIYKATTNEKIRMKVITVILLTGVLALGQCESEGHRRENVALERNAVQSSLYGFGYAGKAVDGDRSGVYYEGSCSHTEAETNPWWRVDLQTVHNVDSVSIVNRADGLSERLNDAEIRIGNSLKNEGNDNPLCAVILKVPPRELVSFNCGGMVGRYINIRLQGYNRILTLCEVEVYARPLSEENIELTPTVGPSPATIQTENVALRKKAKQSSTSNWGLARNAVDGKHSTWFIMKSCTQTRTEADPWWSVDLLGSYNVTSVTITNRDDCCAEMIDQAEIRIGNSLENNGNNNPVCAVISSFPAWETRTFQCHGMEGRYVNIFLPGCNKYLTLCEVEVNAEPLSESSLAVESEFPDDLPEQVEDLVVGFFGDFVKALGKTFEKTADLIIDDSSREHVPLVSHGDGQPTQQRDGHKHRNCERSREVDENAATGARATQSTQWDEFGDPENAIDRELQGVYLKGSCSHTAAETNPWWRVDLLATYNITSVAITNREDCCSERINGAEIHIGNSLKNNGNDNPLCAVIPYIPAGQTRTYQCHGMQGRYVSILLPGKEKYLTLCEVEVNGSEILKAE
ncbi:hypothetical protein GJAV_G00019850 [Gymnothorax javanicus]|nr:hypothetical protein GJAV_G00019850 [Gymnothorax javanicus]